MIIVTPAAVLHLVTGNPTPCVSSVFLGYRCSWVSTDVPVVYQYIDPIRAPPVFA